MGDGCTYERIPRPGRCTVHGPSGRRARTQSHCIDPSSRSLQAARPGRQRAVTGARSAEERTDGGLLKPNGPRWLADTMTLPGRPYQPRWRERQGPPGPVSRRVRTTTAPVVAWWAVSIRVPCSRPGGGSAEHCCSSQQPGRHGRRPCGLRGPRLRLGLGDATGRGSAGARWHGNSASATVLRQHRDPRRRAGEPMRRST
jgi:hypothetical protein